MREIEGAIIKPSLVPEHVRQDIGQVGLEAFERYWRDCCNDPERMRRHKERVAEYQRRRAQAEAVQSRKE